MKKIILLGLMVSLPINTFAAETLPTPNLDEVVVTASRNSQSTKTVTGDITVIDSEEINRLRGGSIADLLRLQPGVETYTNGGMGTSSNIGLRGTNDNQLIVLVDGVRINSGTTGTTAFENIPLALIDRIEILRGPASSLYGSDAIGGVIQIFTKRGKTNNTHLYANAGAGSYDAYSGNAGFDTAYQALKFGAQVSNYDTRGISAKKRPTAVAEKDRDGYNNFSGTAYADLDFAPGHSLGLNYLESKGRNQYDSTFIGNYLERYQQGYGLTLRNALTDHWNSKVQYSIGRDQSFSVLNAATNNNIETEQRQLSWQHDYKLSNGTLTFAYDRLEQEVLTENTGRRTLERSRSNDAFVLGYVGKFDAHSTQLSLREDHNSQFGNYTTGGIGYGYAFSPAWQFTTQYGSSFRAPTFNQLYANNFGNPNLPSEKADNIEASLRYQGQQLQAKFTVFDNHIRNFIQNATTGCPTGFPSCAVNAGKIEIQGMTLESSLALAENWFLSGNLTVQSPRVDATDNLLIRRAQRFGNLVLQYKNGAWDWSSELSASSERYNDTANRVSMSGYALLNSTLAYQIDPHWRLQARANNILDKNYVLAIAPGNIDYTTMGTNVFVSLSYDMK
ncbi:MULTISPECIES: TonB-dependent receptor domain-containing protein [unclassified Methylophilus]|uniref:TonB-dependent receptor domain-containing protein n=1 Tax=unclassified Methylophilus TaxID=2630143 RepID=UPI0006FE49FB|nr:MULTISPECIES: TonB-dependent receptor [unclassified Methylophilus]KQT41137.1 TonB-dependent receptor [Methylophilus sp. Leaf416]KQT58347.1 TonB-dependent receptor [Methylophilus sp. Leaf459]